MDVVGRSTTAKFEDEQVTIAFAPSVILFLECRALSVTHFHEVADMVGQNGLGYVQQHRLLLRRYRSNRRKSSTAFRGPVAHGWVRRLLCSQLVTGVTSRAEVPSHGYPGGFGYMNNGRRVRHSSMVILP
jgi:hypothetical protein